MSPDRIKSTSSSILHLFELRKANVQSHVHRLGRQPGAVNCNELDGPVSGLNTVGTTQAVEWHKTIAFLWWLHPFKYSHLLRQIGILITPIFNMPDEVVDLVFGAALLYGYWGTRVCLVVVIAVFKFCSILQFFVLS